MLDNEFVEKLTRDDIKQFLAEETLFSDVDESALDRLVSVARQTGLAKDRMLFSEGQPCCLSGHSGLPWTIVRHRSPTTFLPGTADKSLT